MRGAATRATSRPRRPKACCGRASARSTCRRSPTARRSTTSACASSLHPAGHVLGSAQVRLEHGGRVWVASGDYYVAGSRADPREDNPTCAPFEPVRCDCFITESTFGLPIYRWQPQAELFARDRRLVARQCRRRPGQPADGLQLRQGAAHPGRRRPLDRADLRAWRGRAAEPRLSRGRRRRSRRRRSSPTSRDKTLFRRALVVAPPSVQGSPWMRRFGDHSDAFASGWMQLRGARRRRAVDRGFVL